MIGWMNDVPGNLGHRMWILSPEMKKTGFGFTGDNESCMYVSDNSRTEPFNFDYIAWPAKGNFPIGFFSTRSEWSVSISKDIYSQPDSSKVNIEFKRMGDGITWNYNKDTPNVFGADLLCWWGNYFLTFCPVDISSFKAGDEYNIKITGLTKLDGTPATIEYRVTFFNLIS